MISEGVLSLNPLIELDDNGLILSILANVSDRSNTEYFEGLLIPGMVNTHCHLEYSYLKGKIAPGGGLPHFIRSIIALKKDDSTTEQEIINSAQDIDSQMFAEGIVAVGDHNNNDFVMSIKRSSKIYYHTFVELFGLGGDDEAIYLNGLTRKNAHKRAGLDATITPHACYSMSDNLLALTGGKSSDEVVSIHFKESLDMGGANETDRVYSALWNGRKSTILVHGIYATEKEIKRALELYNESLTIAICPLSNYFIESRMADIEMLRRLDVRIAIGTDSLSSNSEISMVAEMVKIAQEYPEIPLTEIVSWATINGAQALGIESWAGSIEVGKRPGLVQISNFDGNNLTSESRGRAI